MIININNLKSGIRRWDQLNFPPDILNAEYHAMYKSRVDGVTQQWWSSAADRLGQWRAYRGPSPPNSHYEITQRGLACLPDIAAEYARLVAMSSTEPSITVLSWEDVAPLFALAYGIKPSFVFASKMCHFIFPKLFIVMDNQLTEPFEYEFYWRGMKDEWGRFTQKQEAVRVLTDSIKADRPLHPLYPWETKIMELSHAGYKHAVAAAKGAAALAPAGK
jgi:hypothetical protein